MTAYSLHRTFLALDINSLPPNQFSEFWICPAMIRLVSRDKNPKTEFLSTWEGTLSCMFDYVSINEISTAVMDKFPLKCAKTHLVT